MVVVWYYFFHVHVPFGSCWFYRSPDRMAQVNLVILPVEHRKVFMEFPRFWFFDVGRGCDMELVGIYLIKAPSLNRPPTGTRVKPS
jgi:hypothetical protein